MENVRGPKKILITFLFICITLFLFRPFVANQIGLRGHGYFGYSMYKDAIRQYKKVLILDPKNSEIRNWLGYVYRRIGDTDKSITTYEKAIMIDPEDSLAYHDLGMIYIKDRKFKQAKVYFSKALSIMERGKDRMQEDYPDHYYSSLRMLSVCRERLGENESEVTHERSH